MKKRKGNSPITFELDEQLLSKLKDLSRKVNSSSISETIRHALKSFKFHSYKNNAVVSKQISVRLPIDLKNLLNQFSTKKRVSIGELLRVAINDLCSQSPKHQTLKAMIMATTKKSGVKKSAKKSGAKKTSAKKSPAKKAGAKKATAKKTVAKKSAKKAVARKPAKKASSAKKKTAKKAVAKRPTARKTVARKSTAKKK